MKIQILTNTSYTDISKNFTVNNIDKPMNFDEFDFNVIDFNDKDLWVFFQNHKAFKIANTISNLFSKIIKETTKSKTLIVIPQNLVIESKIYEHDTLPEEINLFNKVDNISISLSEMIINFQTLRYEISTTTICDQIFSSDFVFDDTLYETIKKSNGNKDVIIKYNDNIFITTLELDDKNMITIIDLLQSQYKKSEAPAWFKNIRYLNDNEIITKKEELEQELKPLEKMINQNNTIKSILYSNGDELVSVVIDILCDIFKVSNEFSDIKKEDFKFIYQDTHFMVEIKGINTNVKDNNIAQCKKFVTELISKDETISTNNVKGILIINPQREIEPSQRQAIHNNQIEYSKRENVLIVTTSELLNLHQAYKQSKISTDECFDIFKNKNGVFAFKELT